MLNVYNKVTSFILPNFIPLFSLESTLRAPEACDCSHVELSWYDFQVTIYHKFIRGVKQTDTYKIMVAPSGKQFRSNAIIFSDDDDNC